MINPLKSQSQKSYPSNTTSYQAKKANAGFTPWSISFQKPCKGVPKGFVPVFFVPESKNEKNKGNPDLAALKNFSEFEMVEKLSKSDFSLTSLGHSNLVHTQNGSFLWVGAGIPKYYSSDSSPVANPMAEKMRSLGGHLFQKVKSEKLAKIAIYYDSLSAIDSKKTDFVLENILEGFALSAYAFDKYFLKEAAKNRSVEIVVYTENNAFSSKVSSALIAIQEKTLALHEAVTVARDWSNEPSNWGTPEYFAEESKKWAKKLGLKCKVLTEKEIAEENMDLFLAVGAGSDRPGRIVVLEYNPPKTKSNKQKTIAWVGKGITFDSGGISLKPGLRMEEMKHDMTGAASLFGALVYASRLKVPHKIVCILGFTENMPSGKAVQPGNVVISRSGKSVEIVNTDAEGRLILADLLDFAADFKPDVIINAATLTGAMTVALGRLCAGIMSNNSKLVSKVEEISHNVGERVWELPLWDDYMDDLKTECADMRNVANDGAGGTIRGGIFLKQFIRDDIPWVHFDIASKAWGVSHLAYMPKKGASGAFVRLFAKFAEEF